MNNHDITNPANAGRTRAGRRYCVPCQDARQAAMRAAVSPWAGPACANGHDVTVRRNIGRHVRSGIWVQFCLLCAEVPEDPESPIPGARGVPKPLWGEDRWKADARCGGIIDPEEFFGGVDVASLLVPLCCARCPVVRECGAYADRYRAEGLWGGTYRVVEHDGAYRVFDLSMGDEDVVPVSSAG